jgi:hypothetical protein
VIIIYDVAAAAGDSEAGATANVDVATGTAGLKFCGIRGMLGNVVAKEAARFCGIAGKVGRVPAVVPMGIGIEKVPGANIGGGRVKFEGKPCGKFVPAVENSSGDVCLGIFANEMLGIGGTDMPGIEKL